MGFVIGLIIGVALGAAIAYFLTSKKAAVQSASVQDLQRQLALAESEHERRLEEVNDQLQQAYSAQAASTAPTAQASPSLAISPAASTPSISASPPAANESELPPPAPPTAESSPELTPAVVPFPTIATAPAPVPQRVTESPAAVSAAKPKRPAKALQTSVRISDPSAVLAASYSPQAQTRSEVAAAIAQVLPTAAAPEQARWLPVLGRLARDANPTVRLSAVQALGQMKSAKRLPILQRSLKDASPAVVAAANAIIAQKKGYSRSPTTPKKRHLPKNR
ncbi:MAG: HEAT repeat domain-containing protein [Cyanobacteria bacterium P01_C01_bin.120]